MTDAPVIRQFLQSEWRTYRDLRLRALKDSPDAFGSTFAGLSSVSDAGWIRRLESRSPDYDLCMGAISSDSFAGLAWAKIEDKEGETAHLYQMWVAPEFRRKGIAAALLNTAIEWACTRGRTSMLLEVTCGDSPARRFYDSFGFKPVGEPVMIRPDSDLLEQSMSLEISGDRSSSGR